jgi:general stress protein 26
MSDQQVGKLWEMIKDTRFAMLTSDDNGELRSRPMVACQQSFEGTLWFFTREHAHKVDEIRRDSRVNVSYADPSAQNYVSLSGRASLVTDKAILSQHWSESLRTWFPKGLDDPEVSMLKVVVNQAEYWDVPNSKMVYAYGYVKARITGQSPDPGEHETVAL